MSALPPFEPLYTAEGGDEIPLPPALGEAYGPLRLTRRAEGPRVLGNFVSTLDGVVSLGTSGGGAISGFNPHDALLMGLLRAVSDAVVVGAGTLRSVPDHLWTAEYIFPRLADDYRRLRASLGKPPTPLNVVVSASGRLDPKFRVLQSGEVPALVITSANGAGRLSAAGLPAAVTVATAGMGDRIRAQEMLQLVRRFSRAETVLVEGGPQLLGDFLAGRCLDELFLTLAPQVAGRDDAVERPGFVAGKRFAPEAPLWATLVGVRRAASHLFLRYEFGRPLGEG